MNDMTTTPNERNQTMKTMKPTVCAFYEALKQFKTSIDDGDRATDDFNDNTPGMCVTFATDESMSEWAWQTGDNSFAGACYHLPHWAVIYLYRDSNCMELAREVMEQLEYWAEA